MKNVLEQSGLNARSGDGKLLGGMILYGGKLLVE